MALLNQKCPLFELYQYYLNAQSLNKIAVRSIAPSMPLLLGSLGRPRTAPWLTPQGRVIGSGRICWLRVR
jgi:hypothetical protein